MVKIMNRGGRVENMIQGQRAKTTGAWTVGCKGKERLCRHGCVSNHTI